jgi:hypothetical protein
VGFCRIFKQFLVVEPVETLASGFFCSQVESQPAQIKVPAGRRKIAVKVVDIFGNDIIKILDVTVTGGQWQFIPRFLQEAKIPQKDFFPAFHVTLEVDK